MLITKLIYSSDHTSIALNYQRLIIALFGLYLIVDGIGSVFVQPNQPFFWFQFIRVVRAAIGALLLSVDWTIPRK